jgi:hypothetical protein
VKLDWSGEGIRPATSRPLSSRERHDVQIPEEGVKHLKHPKIGGLLVAYLCRTLAHRFEYGRDKTLVKIGSPGRIRTSDRIEENKVRGYCLWQEWALGWPSTGSSATILLVA